MLRRHPCIALLAAASICSAPLLAHAVPQQPSPQPASQANDEAKFINVSFSGGTMAAYFDAIRGATRMPLNTVMSPDVAKTVLGPIELKRVSLNTAVRAIEWAAVDADSKFAVTPMHEQLPHGQEGVVASTFLIQGGKSPSMPYQGPIFPPSPAVRVIGIRDLLVPPVDAPDAKVYSTKEIVDALDGAMRFAVTDRAEPKVAVHESSGLILIQGSADHAAIAETYIKQLRTEQQAANASARAQRIARDQAAQRDVRIEETILEAAKLESEAQADLDVDRAELGRLLADANQTPEKQAAIARLTSNVSRAEASLRFASSLKERARSEKFNPPTNGGELAALRGRIEELAAQVQALESRLPQSRGSGK